MPWFQKRPIRVQAVKFVGDNLREIKEFTGYTDDEPTVDHCDEFIIETLEGDMAASVGDWIVCGVSGEYYPVKPDIFDKTYEPVDGP